MSFTHDFQDLFTTIPLTPPQPSLCPFAYIPISPPVPHRKAPKPPSYLPRRSRARHIRMREPAEIGLFTLCEEDELEYQRSILETGDRLSSPSSLSRPTTAYFDIPSTASSDIFPSPRITPSSSPAPQIRNRPMEIEMDLPRSVDLLEEMSGDETKRWSWGSDSRPVSIHSGTECGMESDEPMTPNQDDLDMEDPFASELDLALHSFLEKSLALDSELDPLSLSSSFSHKPPVRPRRPPPLDLNFSKYHPFSFDHIQLQLEADAIVNSDSNNSNSHDPITPKHSKPKLNSSTCLLPPAEIISPSEYYAQRETGSPSLSYPTLGSASETRTRSRSRSRSRSTKERDSHTLLSTFEDLLVSAGESPSKSYSNPLYDYHGTDSELSGLFPMPPIRLPTSRSSSTSTTSTLSSGFSIKTPTSATHSLITTPRTPQRNESYSYCHPYAYPYPPGPPSPKTRKPRDGKESIKPSFRGDHSFLFNMSKGDIPISPPMSASSYCGSTRSSMDSNSGSGSGYGSGSGSGWSYMSRTSTSTSMSSSSSIESPTSSSRSSGKKILPRRNRLPTHWL